MVKIYTKNNCQPCRMTKMKLSQAGVVFEEVNIDDDPEALNEVINMGYLAAPVVLWDDASWSGFQPDKINDRIL